MYTKEELTYQILTQVNGGRNTQDAKIRPEDIAKYLPSAINYAILKQYYINKREGERTVPGDFIATYEDVEVKYSASRDLRYIDLPARVVPLPRDLGINTVSPMQGDAQFSRTDTTQLRHLSFISKHVPAQTFWFIEGQKIYFKNIPQIVDKVLLRMIASVDNLGPDDMVPLPAGLEVEVIEICRQFFTGQRSLPADMLNDNNDNNGNA